MTRLKSVYVLGAGGHAKVVVSTLQAAGVAVTGLFDDDRGKWNQRVSGVLVLGALERGSEVNDAAAVIGIGDNGTRQRIAEQYDNFEWLSIIHPSACVHPSARLGRGTVVFAGAVIQPDARIGDHGIANTMVSVDHDCRVERYVHLAPGVHLAGHVLVGEGVLIGVGSAVIPHVSIGARTVVGAGSAVVGDLPPDVTASGVPARILRIGQHA